MMARGCPRIGSLFHYPLFIGIISLIFNFFIINSNFQFKINSTKLSKKAHFHSGGLYFCFLKGNIEKGKAFFKIASKKLVKLVSFYGKTFD